MELDPEQIGCPLWLYPYYKIIAFFLPAIRGNQVASRLFPQCEYEPSGGISCVSLISEKEIRSIV